ncbi:MAG: permease [Candidatus Neomarinimicrobiota bacterium]
MGKINDFINEVSNLFVEIAPYLILGFIVSGFLYMFTSKEMITKNVGTPGFMSVLKASILGVPMPLCSCGVIPVSTSMYKRGATKGATLSFLISTPQTGVDSILLTLNQMGPQFAIIRPIVALITGVIGGMFGDLISDNDYKSTANVKHKHEPKSLLDGLKYSFITLPQDVIKPLIKGIIISGFISILLPNDFFASYNLTGITAMIIIAIASVPIYVCATASVPIAMMLISKGLEPGAAFVFLMAGPATNAATISVIINSLGKKIVYVYISVIFISSIIFGLLINAFLDPNSLPMNMHHGHSRNIIWNIFSQLSVSGMIIITGYTLFSQFKGQSKNDISNLNQSVDLSIIIKGMTCNHCTETATEAINSCHGVEDVSIDLESGQALISGKNLDEKEIITSINSVGFSISNLS